MNAAVVKQTGYYTMEDIYNLPDGQRASDRVYLFYQRLY